MSLFDPIPIAIANPNFEESTTLPPTGWDAEPGVTLAYDTTTPYEGTQSLIVTAPATFLGGFAVKEYPVQFGEIYKLSAALKSISGDPIALEFIFLDQNDQFISSGAYILTLSLSWVYLTGSLMVPQGAVKAQLYFIMDGPSGGVGEVDAISLTVVQALPYYLNLFTSAYKLASTFLQWACALLKPFVDIGIAAAQMFAAFDVDAAIGAQLDLLGTVIGASRRLPFQPTVGALISAAPNAVGTGYVDGDVLNVIQGGASGGQIQYHRVSSFVFYYTVVNPGTGYVTATGLATTGGSGTGATVDIVGGGSPSALLDDTTYRLLIKATIARNQWNGQIESLYGIWTNLFPGGRIVVVDNMNMTASIIMIGAFTSVILDMIRNGLIVPRPQGVQYNYIFGALPVFGFDSNNQFVAGFDKGHWA